MEKIVKIIDKILNFIINSIKFKLVVSVAFVQILSALIGQYVNSSDIGR